MINKNTGEIELADGLRLTPGMKKARLSKSPVGREAAWTQKGGSWSTAKLPDQRHGEQLFSITLNFESGALREVSLMDVDAHYGTGWEDHDEKARKDAHDKWLASVLGDPPYQFPWGDVQSTHDPQSDVSEVTIRYKVESAGWRRMFSSILPG